MTATIRQPRTEVTDMSFAARDGGITNFAPTNQESILLQPIKTKLCPASKQQSPEVGSLENKAVLRQDRRSMADLVEEEKTLKTDIMEMLSEHKNLCCGSTIKATNHTIDLKNTLYPPTTLPRRTKISGGASRAHGKGAGGCCNRNSAITVSQYYCIDL